MVIRRKLRGTCTILDFYIGTEFQKEFPFDNKLVGRHWDVLLVGAFFVQFDGLGCSRSMKALAPSPQSRS